MHKDLPVIRRDGVPLGTTLELGSRAVLINTAASKSGDRVPGWSRYTLGQLELERDRRRYKRDTKITIRIDESMFRMPPPEDSVFQDHDLLRPVRLELDHDLVRRVQAALKDLLGETRMSAVAPELYPPPYEMTFPHRSDRPCRVYWGSHSCMLASGHDGPHICQCAFDEHVDGVLNVGAPPYYGPGTNFYGEDVD